MKNLSSLLLAVVLLLSLIPATALAADVTATKTASKVTVNGEVESFDAYTINGNNYFKLRDIAYVLSGTEKQFEVTWDGAKNAINLMSNKAYTVTGGEMSISAEIKAKSATLSTSKIYLDDNLVSVTAYTINGNNYFKLRDLGSTFNVGIEWDGKNNTIVIDTKKDYVDETKPADTSKPWEATKPVDTRKPIETSKPEESNGEKITQDANGNITKGKLLQLFYQAYFIGYAEPKAKDGEHWAYPYAFNLNEFSLIRNFSDYNSDEKLNNIATRYELACFATMLHFDLTNITFSDNLSYVDQYSDVSDKQKYEINYVLEHDIMSGKTKDKFSPSGGISEEEAKSILSLARNNP